MLIPESSPYNLKDFELFVGDDGPSGSFRSIGSFAAQNIKMMQSPYQSFKFQPVTARFLKVAWKTDAGGGYVSCFEFRLHGKLDAAAAAAAAPAATSGIDLLSAANGGALLAAPNDAWKQLTDGSEERATPYAGEGVNMAMLDALELSESLTHTAFDSIRAAIANYEARMFKRFARIGRGTMVNTEWMHGPDALKNMLAMFGGNVFRRLLFWGKMWVKGLYMKQKYYIR